jgi:hypothetical protein
MVPRLAILPAWIVGGMVLVSGGFSGFLLTMGLILAYSAAVNSLGLALATWVPRLGRAVSLNVTAFVLVSVGWPILMALVSTFVSGGNYRAGYNDWLALSTASPFVGIAQTAALTGDVIDRRFFHNYGYGDYGGPDIAPAAAAFWTLAYSLLSLALVAATLLTFNRCMGRVSDRPRSRPAVPPVSLEPALAPR